jgi:hypothetical protein
VKAASSSSGEPPENWSHEGDREIAKGEGEIVVELKAVKALEDVHFAQVKSYLKATGLHVGLLMNFNAPTLIVKRVVLDLKPAAKTSQ